MSYIIQNETGWFWCQQSKKGFWSQMQDWAIRVNFSQASLLVLYFAFLGVKVKLVKVEQKRTT